MKWINDLFGKKAERDEVVEWVGDRITLRDKKIHSVVISEGVYMVNGIEIKADTHTEALRIFNEHRQSSVEESN